MGLLNHPLSTGRPYSVGSPHFSTNHVLTSKRLIITAVAVTLTGGAAVAANAVHHEQSAANTKHTALHLNVQSEKNDNATSSANPETKENTSSSFQSTTTTSHNSSDPNSSVEMTVNGQPVNVPEDGSSQQTINSADGTTTVNVSTDHSTEGKSFNSSVTSTRLHSSSTASNNVSVETHSVSH